MPDRRILRLVGTVSLEPVSFRRFFELIFARLLKLLLSLGAPKLQPVFRCALFLVSALLGFSSFVKINRISHDWLRAIVPSQVRSQMFRGILGLLKDAALFARSSP